MNKFRHIAPKIDNMVLSQAIHNLFVNELILKKKGSIYSDR